MARMHSLGREYLAHTRVKQNQLTAGRQRHAHGDDALLNGVNPYLIIGQRTGLESHKVGHGDSRDRSQPHGLPQRS